MNTETKAVMFVDPGGERRVGSLAEVFAVGANSDMNDVWTPDAPTRFVALHFLIGLAQTALAPAHGDEWCAVLARGGFDEDVVKRQLSRYFPALDPTQPNSLTQRFRPAGADVDAAARPLASLHLCEPSADNIIAGVAFFQKQPGYQRLGSWFALLALYGSQCVHLPGGGGYYNLPTGPTALRGLMVGRNLFETIWLNVMPTADEVMLRGAASPPVDGNLFPWLRPEVSDLPPDRGASGTLKVAVETLHPAAVYWSAGRRYVLLPDPNEGECEISGLTGPTFSRVARWPSGLMFTTLDKDVSPAQAGWVHPLAVRETIAKTDGDSPVIKAHYYPSLRAPLRLDDWAQLLLVANNGREKKAGLTVVPPPVVRDFVLQKRPLAHKAGLSLSHVRLDIGGYFSTGKVVHGWTQKSLPSDLFPDRESVQAFTTEVTKALQSAQAICLRLVQSVKAAGFAGNPADIFWTGVEGAFAELVGNVRAALHHVDDEDALTAALSQAASNWNAAIRKVAMSVFDAGLKRMPPEAIDQTVATARRALMDHGRKKPKKAPKDPVQEAA